MMMLSFFYKNAFLPQKRQNGAKVGRAVGLNQLFCILLYIGSLDYFDILHKVRGYQQVIIQPFARWKENFVNVPHK